VFALWDTVRATALPATLENGLINGTNTYGSGGSKYETVFKAGTKYRIRIVNAATEGHFRFAIDNHTFTVIANDLVPLIPYKTDSVCGQIFFGCWNYMLYTDEVTRSSSPWASAMI
jgi:FtsP/CotA-like multicopper oxidase with cupredoxin domain